VSGERSLSRGVLSSKLAGLPARIKIFQKMGDQFFDQCDLSIIAFFNHDQS